MASPGRRPLPRRRALRTRPRRERSGYPTSTYTSTGRILPSRASSSTSATRRPESSRPRRAYFTDDQAALDALVPSDTVVLEGPVDAPFVRKPQILESARRAAAAGSKLVRLEFPQTELQVYGATAILYTTYLFELESAQGQRQTTTGRATEIFVRRNGAWVNPGWHMSAAK
ncbi:MAG TPA: nuclear transport factor 2 family protein [Vicinamibacterales bacterium]|nr:nuclear transport factor 2 family protein [Vicinamibacterales bacterium]